MSDIYGTSGKIITSKTYEDAREERAQGVIRYSFTGSLSEAVSDAPKLGTLTDFFPGLVLQKRQFNEGNELTEVTLTFYKTEAESTDEEVKEPSYDLKKQEKTVSILLNPHFKNASTEAKTIAKALLDGTDPYEKIFYRITNGVLEIKKEKPESGNDWKESQLAKMGNEIAGTDEIGKKLLEKIRDGVRDYQAVTHVWTETIYARSISNYTARAGEIDFPPGPQPNVGGNWLYKGVTSATKTRSEKLWKIVREWESSQEGTEWDKEIY